jgi:hypothetical protein
MALVVADRPGSLPEISVLKRSKTTALVDALRVASVTALR